jgi:hypothetical protein
MAEFTDISQLGITKATPKITVVPEEETILAKELTEGEGSNLIGGFMSGLQNADWANLGRIARANLSSNTLNKFSWFLNQPIKGDVAATEEVEEGWNYMSAQEQLGITDEQWDAMPTKERITRLKANAVKSTDEFFNVNPDSPAYVLGNVAGTLTTPTLAFTMAKPAAVATYAGADAALYGMGDTGEVDPLTVGIAAATGGTLSKGIQLYGKGKANRTLGALQNEMNIIAAQSDKINSGPALLTQAKKNLGLSDSAVDKAIANSKGKKLNLPTKSSAIEALEASSAQEVVKSGSKTALGKGLDYIIEPISEGIKRISPRTYGKLKQVERTLFEDSHNYATMVDPFLKKAFRTNALNKAQKDKLWLMMSNSKSQKDVDAITGFLKGTGKKGTAIVKDWKLYRRAMDDIYDQRVAAGNTDLPKITGYSPRKIVSNERWYAGAKASERSAIDRILKDTYKVDPKNATEATLQKAISKYLKSTGNRNIQQAGSSKARVRETLSAGQLKAYQQPWQATHRYIKESMEEVQRYKVFGTKNIDVDGDIDKTISNYIAKELKAGKISGNDVDSLKEYLTARFINGPKQMNEHLRKSKDLGYMTLLGHPSNAIRQFGDLAAAAYTNGIKNSVKGAIATMSRGKMLTPKEMGLLDNVAEEFASDTATKRGVDAVFKYSGFRSVDALGKGALVNSSIYKAGQQMKSPKGRIKFMNEWSSILGAEDAAKAADDFKAFNKGTIDTPTPLMKDVAFMKLSKIQPVTLSEMPRGYLNNPNGRMMYMLQSFAMKHVNVIRQDFFKEMRRGNVAKAMKDGAKLAAFYTSANMGADKVIDLILGRDTKLEDTFYANLYRSTGFLSKYDVDQMARGGDVYEWAAAIPVPPLDPVFKGAVEAGQIAANLARGRRWDSDMKEAGKDMFQNLPIIGRLMANWLY